VEQAAESAAALCWIHAGKVNVGLARPGLGDEPGQPAVVFGGETGVGEVLGEEPRKLVRHLAPPHHWSMTEITNG
jgi:hypothetical protein